MAQQPAMLQHGGMRGFEHLEHHNPHGAGGGGPVMDEFLDHMFAMQSPASCFDMGPRGGVAGWEYSSSNGSSNAAAAAAAVAAATVAGHQASVAAAAAAMAGGQGPQGDNNSSMGQKLFTMSLMPPGLLSGVLGGNQGLSNNKKGNESIEFGGMESQMQQDSSAREGRNELIEGGGGEESNRRVRIPGGGNGGDGGNGGAGGQMGGMAAAAGHGTSLTRSASLGSSGSEDSGPQQQQQRNGGGKGGDQSGTGAPVAPTWYNGGGVTQMPMGLTPAKAENVLVLGEIDSHDTQSLGKRFREDDDALLHESRPRTTGVMPTGGVQGPGYGSGGVMSQSQPLPGMGARPRVRARRGQATDPHSIAERLRRERIAERMKALQELVPNSNKTDKASMLDEIIEYVRFLQLQVKVLSMSRMGGAGALVADLPPEGGNSFSASAISSTTGVGGSSQDGLALTERQVTRLMEDDMGSAMQYLQSKGLCLMPISLASAISTTSKSQGTLPSTGAGQNQLTAAAGTNGKGPAGSSAGAANKEGSLESGRAGDAKSPKNEGSFEEDT